jgi:hypothetical protein
MEIEKQRDRADNKNPNQSWVAQLVIYKRLSVFLGPKE